MSYDFYPNLTKEEQERYDLMLETNYVLLRCDEWSFLEFDETGKEYRSVSWIQSLQPTLDLFGLDSKAYPQGSISANRHYYEALRNYFGGAFPSTPEFNFFREGLKNLLTLRRDDSSANLSYLFGSHYKVLTSLGTREPKKYRSVEANLRHSATALWILCEESGGNLSQLLCDSLVAFFDRLSRYLTKNEDWQRDSYKHLTLSSTMKTCESAVEHFSKSELTERATAIKDACREAILSKDCLVQSISGDYFWLLPDVSKSQMARYEFYLNGFVLTQGPELIEDIRVQSVVRTMLKSKVRSEFGLGIPINFSKLGEAEPDFGASATCLFVLWYSLNNNIGDAKWLGYCKAEWNHLLNYCLNSYDKKETYILPHSENNTKILFLPRFNLDEARSKGIEEYVIQLKRAISVEMKQHKGKLHKLLSEVPSPQGLEHVKEIITMWQITKYWSNQKRWAFDAWSEVGQVLGGYTIGALRALSSIS